MSSETPAVEDIEERDFLENPDKRYYVRFGSFILDTTHSEEDTRAVHAALVEGLRADSRVKSVDPGVANHEWTIEDTWYPTSRTLERGALLSGSDHFHSARFSDAIMFEVYVPAKNQPTIHGEAAEVDSYEVAWDGCTAVVMWPREESDKYAPAAAGQVVVDILRKASSHAGHGLYVQACSPACQHLFAHKEIRVNFWKMEQPVASFQPEGTREIDLYMGGDFSPLGIVEFVHDTIKEPAAEFAQAKNLARRILDLENEMQSMTIALINHDYATLQRSQDGFFRRIGHRFGGAWKAFRGKGRAKEENVLISSLWLAMASLSTLQRTYRETERDYLESASEWADPELFSGDLKSDESRVGSIDPEFPRAAIEHKSTRLDNRGVVWATAGGAVAGAVITAAAGGLLDLN